MTDWCVVQDVLSSHQAGVTQIQLTSSCGGNWSSRDVGKKAFLDMFWQRVSLLITVDGEMDLQGSEMYWGEVVVARFVQEGNLV